MVNDRRLDTMAVWQFLGRTHKRSSSYDAKTSVPGCLTAELSESARPTGLSGMEARGAPNPEHISTSYVERQNLSIRMGMRRFTRLTNAFSKKLENDMHALAIYFMHYNFVRIHQTLRVTPAMAAGVTERLWDLSDIVRVVDDWDAAQKTGNSDCTTTAR